MKDLFKEARLSYFLETANHIPKCDIQFIILMHIVSDIEELLQVFAAISPIACVIAVPYSIDQITYQDLSKKYNIMQLNMEEILNGASLVKSVVPNIDLRKKTIIVEIGGYFAKAINDLHKMLGENLLGVIEDTEAGHRRYEDVFYKKRLPCPVISVARSSLKATEDFLVGKTCLFSAERLLKKAGVSLQEKTSLILGYGKIGRSLAYALQRFNNDIMVYDIDSIKCIKAISEGFNVTNKIDALKQTDFIYGTTGMQSISKDDFQCIKNRAILFSCSSKQVEFDMVSLKNEYEQKNIFPNFDLYKKEKCSFYVAADGHPINFIDPDARIGIIIALVHAELILAVKYLVLQKAPKEICEIDDKDKQFLASKWLQYFYNDELRIL